MTFDEAYDITCALDAAWLAHCNMSTCAYCESIDSLADALVEYTFTYLMGEED